MKLTYRQELLIEFFSKPENRLIPKYVIKSEGHSDSDDIKKYLALTHAAYKRSEHAIENFGQSC